MTNEIQVLQEKFKNNPADDAVFEELEALLREAGDWRALCQVYRDHVEAVDDATLAGVRAEELGAVADMLPDGQEKALVLVALGDLQLDHAGNHDAGMKAYQTAFKTYPDDTTPLERARRVYRRSDDFDRIHLLYTLELKVTTQPAARAAVLARMAQVKGDDMGDVNGALELLREAARVAPEDLFVEQLHAIYASGESVRQRIAQSVAQAASLQERGRSDEAAELLVQAAQLEYDREGGEMAKAAEYARIAYDYAPSNEIVLTILGELYRELGRLDELRALQEGGVEIVAPVDVLVPVVEESAAEAPAAEESTAEGSAAGESAVEADEQVAEAPAVGAATLILPAVDRTADATSAAADEPDAEADEQVAEAPLDDLEAARRRLDADPADLDALYVVRDALRADGDISGLVAQLEESVKHLRKRDGELEMMLELATTLWKDAGDRERAEYYFKRIKLLDGEEPSVYTFYEDYYENQGEWRKLFALLSGRVTRGMAIEEHRPLAARLADLAENELESPEKAIDVWKSFLREHDGDAEARRQLRRLLEANEKWNSLVDFFKDELRVLEAEGDASRSDRILILEEMAHIYREQMKLDTMVINVLGQLLELDPDHPTAFFTLRELLENNRRFTDLANLLATAAEHATARGDLGSAIEYLTDVANIWQERLNNVTQALPHLEKIVELAPDHHATRERLRGIYEARRDYRSLFDLQLGDAQFMSGAALEEHLEGLLELAQDRLRDPERTVSVLSSLLDVRPEDRELINRLEFIHRKQESWPQLATLLQTKAGIETDDAAAIEALVEAADITESKLEERERAASIWKAILRREPEHGVALDRLTAIHVALEQFDALDALYRGLSDRQAAFDRLYEIFDAAATLLGDVERRRALYRRMATLAEHDIGDTDRVILSLEMLRELSEDPTDVARELIALYRATGEREREIEMNRVLLEYASPGVEGDATRYECFVAIADLESQRGEPAEALDWQLEAVAIRPDDRATLQRAEEFARACDRAGVLVERLEALADSLDDEAARELVWERIARVNWDDLGAHDAAVEYFERLRERHPTEFEFLEALDVLYELVAHPEKRIEVLRAQMDVLEERGATPTDMVDQLSKIADVQRTHLGQRDAARETYAEILDLQSDHLPALRGLKELYREEARWDEVVDCLLRELSLISLDERDEAHRVQMELASVYREHLEDVPEALRYYGQVLAEAPEHEAALAKVETLLGDDELARDAALLLEPIFRELDRPEPLARALEARRRVCDDQFEEQEILDELIPLYAEKLDDKPVAFERAVRQFELDPERDDIWLRVEQLGAALNKWTVLEELFTAQSPLAGHHSPVRYDLLRHLAAIREHTLNKKEEALDAWERLHEYDPLDQPTLEALERLYRRMERHEDLVRVLLIRAEIVDHDDDRIKLLREAATIHDVILEDVEATIDIYRRVLVLEPEHEEAVEALERLLRVQEAWHDLDELYVTQADLTLQPERRRTWLLKLALVRFEELEDAAGATLLLHQLLEEDPGDDEVIAVLRRVDARLAETGAQADLRLDIAQTLEPIYRMRGEHRELVGVLEVRLEFTDVPFERVELYEQLAELFDGPLDDRRAAFDALSQAVLADPEDAGRRERTEALARELGAIAEFVVTLEQAMLDADPHTAAAIGKRVGALYRDALDDLPGAISAYERALEYAEGDEESLHALEGLFEATGDHERLAENLRLQILHGDPGARADLLRRLGSLEENVLERLVEATDAYIELLEAEPDDLEAIDALERLYEAQERWFDLADILVRKAAAVLEHDQQIATLLTLAGVQETRLHNIDDAIAVYQQVLGIEPTHAAALDALDRLYAGEARWTELVEVLRAKLVTATGDDAQNGLELRLATLLQRELFAVEEAIALYRAVLGRTPGEPEAIGALEALLEDATWSEEVARDLIPHYRERALWPELVTLYGTLRAQIFDPAQQAQLSYEIALVQRDGLDDLAAAIEAMAEAWKLDWENDAFRDELVQLAIAAEAWDELAQCYRDVLVNVNDPERLIELHLRLAHLNRDHLDDLAEAEVHLREALNLDELRETTYAEIEAILTAGERWHDFIELLERKFAVLGGADPELGREILLQIARTQEEMLDDGFSAVETYERILQIEPLDAVTGEAINRLLRAQERWQDLALHLEEVLAQVSDPSDLIDYKSELAELLRGELHEELRALDLYREILDLEPNHATTLDSLETIFADEASPVRADVATLLDPIFRRRAYWPGLVDVLGVRAQFEQDPVARLDLLREIAALSEDALANLELAFDTWGQVLREDAEDSAVRTALVRLATHTSRWSELAELYGEVLRDNFNLDDGARAELQIDLGRVYEERLRDLEAAHQTYADVLLVDVMSEPAIDALERLFMRRRDWAGLADFYAGRVDAEIDDGRRREWLERLAALYEDVLLDLDAAIEVYMRIMELAPSDRTVQQTLVRLFSHAKRWHDLADLYRQRAAYATDPQTVLEVRSALARLLHDDLAEIDEALEIYRDILAAEPGHFGTMRALEGLRRDLAGGEDAEEANARCVEVIDILLGQYDEGRHWQRMVDLLEEKAERVPDVASKVATLIELAQLLTRVSDDVVERTQALGELARAFCLDPTNDELSLLLGELADSLQAWNRLVPIYLSGIEASADPDHQARIFIALARLYDGPLEDQESAITAYQQAVELSQDNEEALARLQELYGELELWKPLVAVLERQLEQVYDSVARQKLLKRIGAIYDETLGQPGEAARVYVALREEDPNELSYIVMLERLYDQARDYGALEELLREKLDVVHEGGIRLRTLKRLAALQDEVLGKVDESLETYRQILEHDENDVSAVRAMVRLHEKAERWPELLDMLALEKEFAADTDELNAIECRIAQVFVSELDSPHEALASYAAVIERDERHMSARTGLINLLDRHDTREQAARYLQNAYRACAEWEELEGLYEEQLEFVEDPQARSELFLELAAVQEEHFELAEKAFMTLGRALREMPAAVAVRRELERLARALDTADELVAIYEDALDAGIDDPDVVRDVRWQLGQMYADLLGEPGEAIRHFEAVLEFDAYDLECLDWLDRLFQQERRWEELADVLERKLTLVSPDEINNVCFQLAYLREVVFERHADAFDLYRRVILEDPGHGGALEGIERLIEEPTLREEILDLLEPIYVESGAYAKLVHVYRLRLEMAGDAIAERAELNKRIAAIEIDELGNLDVGYAYLGRALRDDPHDIDAQQRLEALAEERGLHEELVALYEDVIAALTDPVRIVELASRAAVWAVNALGESGRATALFRRVLELEPDNEMALSSLEQIARHEENLEDLADVLARKVEMLFDPDLRRGALLELATICTQLERIEAAIDAYNQALTLDESDVEVMQVLVALYEVSEQYESLVDILERLTHHLYEPETQTGLFMRIGRYATVFLGQFDRALEAYARARELAPDNRDVLLALEELYEASEQWEQLADVVAQLMESADHPDEVLRLYVKQAGVKYEHFGDRQGAIDDYQRAFAIQNDHPLVVEALEKLYRQESRWSELLGLYEHLHALAADDAGRRVALLVQMADVHRTGLGDEETAIGILNQVLQTEPHHSGALDVLGALYTGRGDWNQVLSILERQFEAASERDRRIELLTRMARVLDGELGQLEDAAAYYSEILGLDPLHMPTLAALAEIYERLGAHERIFTLMDHRARHVGDDEARVALYLEMGEYARKYIGDASRRIEVLQKAHALRGEDLEVVEPLLDAYIAGHHFEQAEPLLEDLIRNLTEARRLKEAVRFHHLHGKLCEQKGDHAAALGSFEAAHKIDATYIPNLLSLGKLIFRQGDWDGALKVFQTLLLHQMNIKDNADKVDVYFHLGHVRRELGDARRARDMFTRALSIDPGHEPSREALANL